MEWANRLKLMGRFTMVNMIGAKCQAMVSTPGLIHQCIKETGKMANSLGLVSISGSTVEDM